MAKVIFDSTKHQVASSVYSWWKILLVGAGMGAMYWLFTSLLLQFIIEPIFCGSSLSVDVCSDRLAVSGNLAGIFVALIGLFVLVKLSIPRPLIVVLSNLILLWDLAKLTDGLTWAEIAAWQVLLFAVGYLSLSWLARYAKSLLVIVLSLAVVVLARIIFTL